MDDDLMCLKVVSAMLQRCSYEGACALGGRGGPACTALQQLVLECSSGGCAL